MFLFSLLASFNNFSFTFLWFLFNYCAFPFVLFFWFVSLFLLSFGPFLAFPLKPYCLCFYSVTFVTFSKQGTLKLFFLIACLTCFRLFFYGFYQSFFQVWIVYSHFSTFLFTFFPLVPSFVFIFVVTFCVFVSLFLLLIGFVLLCFVSLF
jgi:hypothetical protein